MLLRALILTLASTISGPSLAADCPNYAADLAAMRVADQSLRGHFPLHPDPSISPRLANASELIDRTNTRRLKNLFKRCGWPATSKYGKEASADAWLLVQHADHDREFQRDALVLLERAVRAGEARGGDLAYLSDRLAVAAGNPQLYGTQFTGFEDCKLVLATIDSREAVNARRRAIPGMPTLEEYEQFANAHIPSSECRKAP